MERGLETTKLIRGKRRVESCGIVGENQAYYKLQVCKVCAISLNEVNIVLILLSTLDHCCAETYDLPFVGAHCFATIISLESNYSFLSMSEIPTEAQIKHCTMAAVTPQILQYGLGL